MDKKHWFNNKITTTYLTIVIITLVGLVLIKELNISYPLAVTTSSTSGELAVVGEGKIEIVPDTASVDLGIVVNDARSVEAAQQGINTINNAIVNAVTALGVKKEDIKTSNYSINPNYNYTSNPNGTITGYNGNTTVTVKVKDTTLLPGVIEAATKAGANQVFGTNYTVDNPNEYREQARDEAIANAKEQANKLAKELGIRLGKVVNIVESGTDSNTPYPVFAERSASMSYGGNAPSPDLQPGSQTITSVVTLYFDKR